MEPGRIRPAATISQRVQDIAERLSTHVKAEIYDVLLEGIAPGGEKSSFIRLEPLINDIVAQLNDGFNQAVTKRLLPEACKLLGSRSPTAFPPAGTVAASSPPPSWPSTQTPPVQPPGSLFSSTLSRHSPPYLENDILALGLAPGTGQPLRPDQGPPQDAASAAASSLLLGTSAAAAQPPATPSSSSGGGGAAASAPLHPPESRFAFANAGDATRRVPLGAQQLSPLRQQQQQQQQSPSRLSYGGGGGGGGSNSSEAVQVSLTDPFLFLGLGEGGTGGLGLGAGDVASAAVSNGFGTHVADHAFLLGPSSVGSSGAVSGSGGCGRATPGSGLPSPSLHGAVNAVRQQVAHLPLSSGGAPSPPPTAGASGSSSLSYSALPLSVRPGSSLDPGLATPPLSLSGTEPLRSPQLGQYRPQQPLSHQQQLQQAQQQFQSGRLSGPGDLSSPQVPLPLFGGAPGPSPSPGASASGGGGGGQQQGLQRQALQQQQHPVGYGGSGGSGVEGGMYGGGGANGGAAPPLLPNGNMIHGRAGLGANTHFQQQQQQQPSLLYLQQQQQQHALMQQQEQSRDGNGYGIVSALRTAMAAAPDGPRASYDGGRPGSNGLATAAGVTATDMPYDFQALYGSSISADVPAIFTSDRFGGNGDGGPQPLRRGAGGGLETLPAGGGAIAPSEYGMYGLAHTPGWAVSREALGLAAAPGAGGMGGGGLGGGGYGLPYNGRGSPAALVLTLQQQQQQQQLLSASAAGGGRSSRSGAASADSRSSSFSSGPGQMQGAQAGALAAPPRRGGGGSGGSGGGGSGAAAVLLTPQPQHPSPPSSDASGPSSAASASTGGVGGAVVLASPTGTGSMGGIPGASLSMAAKLQQQQVASKSMSSPQATAMVMTGSGAGGAGRGSKGAAGAGCGAAGVGGVMKAPSDMPGRFRCLPPAVQARIHALTRDNHVVLLKDFDEKVLSKMTLLVDKFGAAECLAMLDRIEEVLKGKAGRLANGPGYLDVSVSTRLDELKQRASGQVTAPEDYARSTLHSRIYAELRDLIARHGFLQWHHFDQGIINMLKKMPNATALERLNELAYHSFKNVDNPKSCIVSIFTTKPKYVNA